jgi:hypothetical protein
MPDQVDRDPSRPASGGDVGSMELQGAPAIPMTPERAMTSLARCRVAITRAHLALAEAIRIADHLVGDDPPVGDAGDRAARALHLSGIEDLLDELRSAVDGSQPPEPVADRAPNRSNGHREQMPSRELDGEFPPLFERMVVSPGRGRIHLRRIREGRRLDQDVVIAELRTGTARVLIRTPLPAVFLSWLAREGDVVSRGWRIARLLPTED